MKEIYCLKKICKYNSANCLHCNKDLYICKLDNILINAEIECSNMEVDNNKINKCIICNNTEKAIVMKRKSELKFKPWNV